MDKKTYQEKMLAQLDQWQAEMDKLKAQSREASAEMQTKYQEEIETLRKKRDEMQVQYEKVQASSVEAWEDFKKGADQAWDNMAEAMKSAWNRFS